MELQGPEEALCGQRSCKPGCPEACRPGISVCTPVPFSCSIPAMFGGAGEEPNTVFALLISTFSFVLQVSWKTDIL